MKTFTADIIADSINPAGIRVTSFLLTYPRFIHAEIMTHRVFSRNAASSRAIPIEKTIEQVATNPAMPIRWGKNGKGMQDHGEMSAAEAINSQNAWCEAARSAMESAKKLQALGLHKQIVNRVLEPFVWMTTLVTATEWQNFFALRVEKTAQPEFQYLAHMMLKNYLSNKPVEKDWKGWHIPFGDKMPDNLKDEIKLKIATARIARTSYLNMDGKSDVEKDIKLHDILAEHGHWSAFEHVCFADSAHNTGGNFRGWKQYRHMFSNENRTCDLNELLKKYEESIKKA